MGTPNAPYNDIVYIPAGATPQPAFVWHAPHFVYAQLGGLPAPSPQPEQPEQFGTLVAPPIPRSVPGGRVFVTVTSEFGNSSYEWQGVVQAPGIPTAGSPAGAACGPRQR